MTNKDIYSFSFAFFNEQTEEEKEYRFNIHAETPEQVKELEQIYQGEDKNDEFQKQVSKLELEYGIHDASFGEKEFGFNSYEVEPDKYEELMEKWREFFSDRGFNLSAA